jgi:translation initiation factor 1
MESGVAYNRSVHENWRMRPEPKKKIATNQPQTGLNQAFADLEMSGLPDEAVPPALPSKETPGSIWKLGRVVLRKETAHRGGKTVIVVHDFATHLPVSVIETAAKKIRHQCGCGSAVKGRTIEVQGDQAARIRAVLEAEGFQVAGVS